MKPTVESPQSPPRPRLVCFVNGIYASHIAGGDIYFAYIARAVAAAGHPIHFFGGHALKDFLKRQNLPENVTLTDKRVANLGNVNSLGGRLRLLADYVKRVIGSLRRLREVQPNDLAYGATEGWFDTLPLILCRARAKVFHLGMTAPTLGEIIFRKRADVEATRIASLHYWLSQQFSLRFYRRCKNSFVTYAHPDIREYILRFGYDESRLVYLPSAVDVTLAERIPTPAKQFDVAWAGRVHPQKGIDDLLGTFKGLQERLPDFRAVIIGKNKDELEPRVREQGLSNCVTFAGLVSEEEKFRLLKASRVFAMPSHYESWGIVVGEALISGTPVVAYQLQCYPAVFGDFIRYVNCFDVEAFKNAVAEEVRNQREGKNYLMGMDLEKLKQSLRWETSQAAFCKLLGEMGKKAK